MLPWKKDKSPQKGAPAAAEPLRHGTVLTEEMQDALLNDPRVQQSIRHAGAAMLDDPEVQRQIMQACKEKFPGAAAAAGQQVQAWAKDPKVQAKAKGIAKAAVVAAGQAGELVMKQIEQGPGGVRFLAFVASVGSASLAVMSLLNIVEFFAHLILYLVSLYQMVFAITTVLFEMDPEWIVKIQETTHIPVSKYQDMLLENARFLALTGGRGLFYIFQGTLWLAFASFTSLLQLAVGLFLIFVGSLHVMMHFGVAPKEMASKMREGYERVRSASMAAAGDHA